MRSWRLINSSIKATIPDNKRGWGNFKVGDNRVFGPLPQDWGNLGSSDNSTLGHLSIILKWKMHQSAPSTWSIIISMMIQILLTHDFINKESFSYEPSASTCKRTGAFSNSQQGKEVQRDKSSLLNVPTNVKSSSVEASTAKFKSEQQKNELHLPGISAASKSSVQPGC